MQFQAFEPKHCQRLAFAQTMGQIRHVAGMQAQGHFCPLAGPPCHHQVEPVYSASFLTARESFVHFLPAPMPKHVPMRRHLRQSREKHLPPDPFLSTVEQEFVARVFESAGLNRAAYRERPLQRRIRASLRALESTSVAEALHRLDKQPQLLDAALGGFLIGTTSFCRDPHVFANIERDILPPILATTSAPHVWSAGCSDGAELYSIAILLDRLKALDKAVLLGTDCRLPAIQRACAGVIRSPGRSSSSQRLSRIRVSAPYLDLSPYFQSTPRARRFAPIWSRAFGFARPMSFAAVIRSSGI